MISLLNDHNLKLMNNMNQQTIPLTIEEYVRLQLRSKRRHSFVEGMLYEAPEEAMILLASLSLLRLSDIHVMIG